MSEYVTLEYTGTQYMNRRFYTVIDGKRVSSQGYLFGSVTRRNRMKREEADLFINLYTVGEDRIEPEFETAYVTENDKWEIVEEDAPQAKVTPVVDNAPKPAAAKSKPKQAQVPNRPDKQTQKTEDK